MNEVEAAEPVLDPIAMVEVWRERGAAAADPVGFGIALALARRAEAQQGEGRRVMLQRVEERLAALVVTKAPATEARTAAGPNAPRRAALAGLSDLVDRLGRSAASHDTPVTAFKGTWSRLRADQRLRQALTLVPAAAGPLNSSHVVNRALHEMRELSPEYLDAFLSHVDTLVWLEQNSVAGEPATGAVTRSEKRPATPARRRPARTGTPVRP